nr:beta-glucuronidase [uncultured Schaedlerella sp.]
MLDYSELYPCSNAYRSRVSLDGLWRFCFDADSVGISDEWYKKGLSDTISMPVPSAFADLFTTEEERDYCGDFWYETDFYCPDDVQDRNYIIRFGSITHRAIVYCNGQKVAEHEGGFLPVICDVTEVIRIGEANKLIVYVNNELNETSLPCGTVKTCKSGKKLAKGYFDFFNYAGIQRSVYLLQIPKSAVTDYHITYELVGRDAKINYQVFHSGAGEIKVSVYDKDGRRVTEKEGERGTLYVKEAHLWEVRNAYLYVLKMELHQNGRIIDEYQDRIGIRTVAVKDGKILINEKPVYLKGYGKHEDFEILGRTFNWAVAKRDFECMKWSGANCFRTSHYPYAEEWYQMADEEGFLVIDEVPAVGMMRSLYNFADAGTGKFTYFFEALTIPELKKNHMKQIEEMIMRDKNHPSVFAFSLFNEPETISEAARDYFTDVFSMARKLDSQHRPLTGALEKNSSPDKCQCCDLLDFICLNRYYGWYIGGGAEIEEAMLEFEQEMETWKIRKKNIPFIFTEFGADTLVSEHKLPGVMWTQEYQNKYMEKTFQIFDKFSFIQGELVWNFADFQAQEGIMRVNGNKKGVFTRNRQPKNAAYVIKERWEKI